MHTEVRGVQPPMPILSSAPAKADRRSLAIQVVREALRTSPANVAWCMGMPVDQLSRALAAAVAEFNMVTAGLIEPEQGARLGSEGLAASIRLAGIRIVAAPRTPRADCDKGAKMAGMHGRLIAVDECNTRHGAVNA